jgi:TolB-like protein/DNA-binding winged helix-turn-helix (wHTH) protein/Tfp pilus assembly protein PilF
METASQSSPRVRFRTFELDLRTQELYRNGLKLKLRGHPIAVLRILLERPGELVTRETLQKRLWPDDTFVDFDQILNQSVAKLRDALGDRAEAPRFIETLPKLGYRFIAPVEQPEVSAVSEPEAGSAVEPVAIPPADHATARRRRIWIPAAILLLLATAAGAYRFFSHRNDGTIDSVAVLPFLNASGDPNAEYLSDGITESLINSLSQLPNLRVMSRDTVFRFKGKEVDPRTVGREMGVGAIFKGTVTERGDTLSISAELIRAGDNSHIWGQHYERKLTDMDALREEIAGEMASALRSRLTGAEEKRLTKIYTANPEAYQDYLKGRYWWNKSTPEGFDKGIEYFQEAIAKDPRYALAYSGLADCYSSLARTGLVPFNEGFLKAKDAALKAVELDDTLAEAHGSLALVKSSYDWDWSGADKEIQRAIELNPGYMDAHRLRAEVLWQTGRLDEALAELKLTLELDPLSISENATLGAVLFLARQYDRAIEQEAKTLELDPNFFPAYYFRGLAYSEKSLHEQSMEEFRKGMAISVNPGTLTGLGYGYAVTGRRDDAQKVLDKLNELSKHEYVSPVWRAKIYAGLGEKDSAFEWLEKAYEDRSIVSVGFIKRNPLFDPIRSDPRYADLLRRTNLQP